MAAGAQARGVRGAVVSGRARDTAELRARTGFPVFARGTATVGQAPATRAAAVDVPLVRLGVSPGDWIAADLDGVVCVPRERAEEVARVAAQCREEDARCLADIERGVGVQESFRRHRIKK